MFCNSSFIFPFSKQTSLSFFKIWNVTGGPGAGGRGGRGGGGGGGAGGYLVWDCFYVLRVYKLFNFLKF